MNFNKRAQITMYIMYMFVALILIVVVAIIVPMGVLFNAEIYSAGQEIMVDANETAANLDDPLVAGNMTQIITEAAQSTQDNISFGAVIYKYGWIIVLFIIALSIFLRSRMVVEQGGQIL